MTSATAFSLIAAFSIPALLAQQPQNAPYPPSAKTPGAKLMPPQIMHWCSQHCSTWTLDKGAPFDKPHYGSQAAGVIVIVEQFTPELVVMERTDYRPYPGRATLKGKLSKDGNAILDGTIDWTFHPCCGTGVGKFQAAWGSAINTVPGSDADRERLISSKTDPPPTSVAPADAVPASADPLPHANTSGGTVKIPIFLKDKIFTYDLSGEWQLGFPANLNIHSLVLIDLQQSGERIQMLVDSPNTLYPFGATMFTGKYANGNITGDWTNSPLQKTDHGYASTRVSIQILAPTSLVSPQGVKITRSDEQGANKPCDPVKYAGMDQARAFIYGSRDFELRNYGNAACWMFVSASQGHHEAELNVGVFLHFGIGMEKDDVQSFLWLQKSAERGNKTAQRLLAHSYQVGTGVHQDAQQARAWNAKANNGEPEPELPQTPEQLLVGLITQVNSVICGSPTAGHEGRVSGYTARGMTESKAQEAAKRDEADTAYWCQMTRPR